MIQRLREARQSDASGFTLIELLIVIVVLGILAGIVVFGVGTFKADSTTAACKANAKSVEVASQAYIAKTGTIAATVDVLKTANYIQDVPVPAVAYDATTGRVSAAAC